MERPSNTRRSTNTSSSSDSSFQSSLDRSPSFSSGTSERYIWSRSSSNTTIFSSGDDTVGNKEDGSGGWSRRHSMNGDDARLIPVRQGIDAASLFHLRDSSVQGSSSDSGGHNSASTSLYSKIVQTELFGDASFPTPASPAQTRSQRHLDPSKNIRCQQVVPILSFRSSQRRKEPLRSHRTLEDVSQLLHGSSQLSPGSLRLLTQGMKDSPRSFPNVPFKVLDAPGLDGCQGSHLVDWSPTNHLAVGLHRDVYILSDADGRHDRSLGQHVYKITEVPFVHEIMCVKWINDGQLLVVSDTNGGIFLFDHTTLKLVRRLNYHSHGVGSIASPSPSILSSGSGSDSGAIIESDMRSPSTIRRMRHGGGVTALEWDAADIRSLASGGADGRVLIWDTRSTKPVQTISTQTKSVRSLGWNPHARGIIGTAGKSRAGGGELKMWDVRGGSNCTGTLETGPVPISMLWSHNSQEFVTAHGYSPVGAPQPYSICVWRYPTLSLLATLRGHSGPPQYLALSPSGTSIVSGGIDETIRLWSIFPEAARRRGRVQILALDGIR